MSASPGLTRNAEACERPEKMQASAFFDWITRATVEGGRIIALLGTRRGKAVELTGVVAGDSEGIVHVAQTWVDDESYPSLTPAVTQAHLFEREIYEQTGLRPDGHPWLKPVRYSAPGSTPDEADLYQVEGESVHEVGVGPIHAGVIEPGHFRFQCHGETVYHMEITLGYQHRGVERALRDGPSQRRLHLIETASGDSTVAHTLAHCQAVEALSGSQVPPRAQAIRALALELERLANHVGDLGALAGDVGFLPTASYCGRIRGDFLNLTAELCGNRFGRSLIVPGGVRFDIDTDRITGLLKRLETAYEEAKGAIRLLFASASARERFEETGVVPRDLAADLGLVGPAARASGLSRDIRTDHVTGAYKLRQIPVSVERDGDVLARARIRWLEVSESVTFARAVLSALPAGDVRAETGPAAPDHLVVAMVEGWRGQTTHVLGTDDEGHISTAKIIDPSFHNWMGLQMALRGEGISDFPICNKSFNLSYCGHDL